MRPALALLITALLGLAGCLGSGASPGVAAACGGYTVGGDVVSKEFSTCRMFRGRLQLPAARDLTLPDMPFQIVALGFEPTAAPATADSGPRPDGAAAGDALSPSAPTGAVTAYLFYGASFTAVDGAGQRPSIPFDVVVPCGVSVNLMLQVARTSSDHVPGYQVAQMSFARSESSTALTTLVPHQALDSCGTKTNQLDLGLVALTLGKRGVLSSGAIVLGKGNSKNPLTLVGAPDGPISDQDTDGDRIIDSVELWTSLPDKVTPGAAPEDPPVAQPDGIPDLFQ